MFNHAVTKLSVDVPLVRSGYYRQYQHLVVSSAQVKAFALPWSRRCFESCAALTDVPSEAQNPNQISALGGANIARFLAWSLITGLETKFFRKLMLSMEALLQIAMK